MDFYDAKCVRVHVRACKEELHSVGEKLALFYTGSIDGEANELKPFEWGQAEMVTAQNEETD